MAATVTFRSSLVQSHVRAKRALTLETGKGNNLPTQMFSLGAPRPFPSLWGRAVASRANSNALKTAENALRRTSRRFGGPRNYLRALPNASADPEIMSGHFRMLRLTAEICSGAFKRFKNLPQQGCSAFSKALKNCCGCRAGAFAPLPFSQQTRRRSRRW